MQYAQAQLRHALAQLLQAQPVPQQRAIQHRKGKQREQQRVAHCGRHIKCALGTGGADAKYLAIQNQTGLFAAETAASARGCPAQCPLGNGYFKLASFQLVKAYYRLADMALAVR